MQAPAVAEWPASYFDGRSAERHLASVIVQRHGLVLTYADGTHAFWPFQEVRHTPQSGARTQFERGLESLVFEGSGAAAVSDAYRQATRARRRIRAIVIAAIAAPCLALIVGVFFFGFGAGALAALVPVSLEERIGATVTARLAPDRTRCSDPRQREAIQEIVQALAAAAPPNPYRFRVYVSQDREVNAFAAPGGEIVVFRGLLERCATPDELAAVLAHEMQHVLLRHSVKGLCRQAAVSMVLLFITGGGDSSFAQLAATLSTLSYQRGDEEAADREGLRMLIAARFDGRGAIALYRTLQREGADYPAALKYLSTHPPSRDRIAMIERSIAGASFVPRPLPARAVWPAVRMACR